MILNLLAILVSFSSTLFIFRGSFTGKFLGEIFDTRLMIVLHEHWFRFFTGKTTFLDAGFFYPYPRSFALTDTFLLTGVTHSLIRTAGLDVIDSWIISQAFWVFIGLIGWYLLAKLVINNKFLQIITVPLIATSFSFVAHLNERPNVVPYLLVSWVFYFVFYFYLSKNRIKFTLSFGMSILSIPLIVLTSWYAGFLIVIFFTTLILMSILLKAPYLNIFLNKVKNINLKTFLPFGILSFFLTILWAYIYLPELSNSAEVARPKSEVIDGSPTFVDLFNTSALGGSQYFLLFSNSYEVMEENKIGISFLPFLVLIILLLSFQRKNELTQLIHNKRLIYSSLLASLFIEILIIKFSERNSIFIFLFDNISFLKSIRTPVRWHIYFMFLILFLVVYLIDKIIQDKNKLATLLWLLIPIFLLVEQQRISPGLWVKSEFIDQNLLGYQNKVNNCDAFVLDRPNTGYWSDMIQSLPLSIYLDKPTANGYSGSVPKDYPSFNWYSDGDLPAIATWLQKNDALRGTCFLDGYNFENVSKFDKNTIDFIPASGFTGLEKSKTNTWTWSVWEKSNFFIHSFKNNKIVGTMSFTLEIPECLDKASFLLKGKTVDVEISILESKSKKIEIPIRISEWERLEFTIEKDPGFCSVEGDPRELHFSIKDVKVIAARG